MIKSIIKLNDKKRSKIITDDDREIIIFNATIKEYLLKEGQAEEYERLVQIAAEGEGHLAFSAAADALSRGAKSKREMREYLRKKGFSADASASAIAKLVNYNYLEDGRYAQIYAEYKGAKTGRRKLIYDLTAQKGVPKELAEKAVYAAFGDNEEIQKAKDIGQKYLAKNKTKDKLRARVWNYLMQRGFEGEIVSAAVAELDFQGEEDSDV